MLVFWDKQHFHHLLSVFNEQPLVITMITLTHLIKPPPHFVKRLPLIFIIEIVFYCPFVGRKNTLYPSLIKEKEI